jgi:8-oxo-dGTP diphosphatase
MDSQRRPGTENHDKITSETGGTSHRKTNSQHTETEAERRIQDPRAPDRRRGRSTDRCRQGQSLGSQGCHHDGGRRRGRETEKDCLRREIREELPELKLGRLKLWREVKTKNPKSGRKMSDAIFIASKASGHLVIGDKREIDKATWRKPRGIRLTPTSRYVRDKLFPKRG